MQKFRNPATIDTGFVYNGRRVYVDKSMKMWEEYYTTFNSFPIIICSENYFCAYMRKTENGLSKYIDGVINREKGLLEQRLNEIFAVHHPK